MWQRRSGQASTGTAFREQIMAPTVTDIAFTVVVVVDGDMDGVDSGLRTSDGTKVYLYRYRGADVPNVDKNRVVFGRKADANGDPDATGAVVFAAYLREKEASR